MVKQLTVTIASADTTTLIVELAPAAMKRIKESIGGSASFKLSEEEAFKEFVIKNSDGKISKANIQVRKG
jgi:hypothetical protein